MEQLRFEAGLLGAAEQMVSRKIKTPVMRWRKIVRMFDPPEGSDCSRSTFQLVAGVLADYADRNGSSCFPTVATIAKDARRSERRVQYALRALERRGLILSDRRGGRGRPSRYELVCPREKPLEEAATCG